MVPPFHASSSSSCSPPKKPHSVPPSSNASLSSIVSTLFQRTALKSPTTTTRTVPCTTLSNPLTSDDPYSDTSIVSLLLSEATRPTTPHQVLTRSDLEKEAIRRPNKRFLNGVLRDVEGYNRRVREVVQEGRIGAQQGDGVRWSERSLREEDEEERRRRRRRRREREEKERERERERGREEGNGPRHRSNRTSDQDDGKRVRSSRNRDEGREHRHQMETDQARDRSNPHRRHVEEKERNLDPTPSPTTVGAGVGVPSKMDKYFAPDYDPLFDVSIEKDLTDPTTRLVAPGPFDEWDTMLKNIKEKEERKKEEKRRGKEREKKERRRERRRRRGKGEGRRVGKRSTLGDAKGLMEVEYTKMGGTREWDRGKEYLS
ncbi:BQ2448_8089 [Microbotryum intermedium]|uniref:BQ2448_8089 protein n=1 Tax=Microbotryum intermedium TaxID=269621 RepID=A0A238FKY4_9BASI|nr:BQ2448_8089 [Microbotryum intermedium]